MKHSSFSPKAFFICILFLLSIFYGDFSLYAQEQKPFPQHTAYAKGSIKPGQYSQVQLDTSVIRFYDAWKKHYIRAARGHECYVYCNADGLWHGGNKASNSISLSEGHGYGMMITVLMAGYDKQAHDEFDAMLRFFKNHPSNINHKLMAWDQTKDSMISEHNSDDATDGDMDIAYALLMADRQWGSAGRYNYKEEALAVINALNATNVNHHTHLMMMGDFTEEGEPFYNDTRPSDAMPDHFRAFKQAGGGNTWDSVTEASYRMLWLLQHRYSPYAGLFPDFAVHTNKTAKPAPPYFMEKAIDGTYSYNACRVPMRLACDYLIYGDVRDSEMLALMDQWIIKKCHTDPTRIRDGYRLDGKTTPGASGDNIAFIAPFGLAAMISGKNQLWLNRIWDYAIHEPLSDEEYYGNTLKMLSMIIMSGNWWAAD